MGLEIRNIRMRNWKCYRDEEIELKSSDDGNIWIIFGQNGFGKTSIQQAIQWCLYGTQAVPPSELVDFFNRDARADDPELELFVAVRLETDDGTVIEISRSAKREVRGSEASANAERYPNVRIDGVEKNDPREHVEQLLPRSCSQFFFFDGVEIKRYAQRVHTKETKEAIERTLGIPELRNLREDSDKALYRIEDELERATEASEELRDLNFDINEVDDEIATIEDQLAVKRDERQAAQKIVESLQQRAQQVDRLRDQMSRLESLRKEKARATERLDDKEAEIQEHFRLAPVFMLQDYVKGAAEEMERSNVRSQRRTGLKRELKKVLKRDRCVCDRDLEEDARQAIERLVDRIEEQPGGSLEDLRQEETRRKLEHIAALDPPDLDALISERDRLEDDLEATKQEIARIEEEIGDVDEEEAKQAWEKVTDAKADLRGLEDTIARLEKALEEKQKEADELRRERGKIASEGAESKTLAEQARLARGLRDAAQELIDWRAEERRAAIEELTTDIHSQVTNNPDEHVGVEVRGDYTLAIRHKVGREIEPNQLSAGQKEALAYSFISALNLASEKGAPFVMDTPFGHLDSEHQQNVVDSLPELPSQIVVLATDRDFPEELLADIRDECAQILNIQRPNPNEDRSKVEGT